MLTSAAPASFLRSQQRQQQAASARRSTSNDLCANKMSPSAAGWYANIIYFILFIYFYFAALMFGLTDWPGWLSPAPVPLPPPLLRLCLCLCLKVCCCFLPFHSVFVVFVSVSLCFGFCCSSVSLLVCLYVCMDVCRHVCMFVFSNTNIVLFLWDMISSHSSS